MPITLIPTILAFLTEAGPLLSTTASVASAIKTISEVVPVVITTARNLVPELKIAIAAVRGSATTSEQLDQLDAIEAKLDADYDTASAAAAAEDAGAAKG